VAPVGPRKPDEREGLARRHGTRRRRQCRRVHGAMDAAAGDIRAVEFTPRPRGRRSPVPPDLPKRIPPEGPAGTVTGDGAFDTRRCHTAIGNRGGTAVMPIRRNKRLRKEDRPAACAGNDVLRATGRFGRANGTHGSGHHGRGRIEAGRPSQVRLNPRRRTCSTSGPSASASPRETSTGRRPRSPSAARS
jgi:hypothetical protein